MSSRSRRKAKAKKSSSRQPKRWFLFAGLGLVVLLFLAVGMAYSAVRKYLRSDDFRVMLGARAGEVLEGDAEFAPFEWDGWSVSTDEFTFQGDKGLQNLTAQGIDASVDLGAVWGGVYRIEDVRLREVELIGDLRDQKVLGGPSELESIETSDGEGEGGFWASFLPDELELTSISVGSINGRAITDDGLWAWKGTTAKVLPSSAPGSYDVNMTGGEILSPISLMEQLSLLSAKGRYTGDYFYLLSAEFDVLKNSRLIVQGDYGIENGLWKVTGELEGARIEEVIAEDWSQRLKGPLKLDFSVYGKPDADAKVKGSLVINEGLLTALPVLDRIAAYSNTARFRRLSLSDASLDFQKIGSSMELTNIVLASEGLVRLEGAMRIEGRDIRKGDFMLGVTPGSLAGIPGAETQVFKRGKLGLLWAPLKISGTLDRPKEDLSDRLISAAGERMFELIPESGQYVLRYSGEVMSQSTQLLLENRGVIFDTGKAALEGAGKLIEEGTGINPEEVLGQEVERLFDFFGNPVK